LSIIHTDHTDICTYNTTNTCKLTLDGNAELEGLPDSDGARLGDVLGPLLGDAVWPS